MDGHPGSTSPTLQSYIHQGLTHSLLLPVVGRRSGPLSPLAAPTAAGAWGGPLVTTLADGVTIGSEPLPRYRPDGLRIPRDLRVCRFVPREPVGGGMCASCMSRAPLCPQAHIRPPTGSLGTAHIHTYI